MRIILFPKLTICLIYRQSYLKVNKNINRTTISQVNDSVTNLILVIIMKKKKIGHNREAEWLKDVKNELVKHKHRQERVVIRYEMVKRQCSKMSSWKAP